MSIRRRLTALEQHTRAAAAYTTPNRLSPEELAAVVDLAKRGTDTPVAGLSPLALEVLPKVRHFTAFFNQMAKRSGEPRE